MGDEGSENNKNMIGITTGIKQFKPFLSATLTRNKCSKKLISTTPTWYTHSIAFFV